MVNFSQIISASIEWTVAVLFRPFKPKKWLVLAFIALLAGQLTGAGCNNSFNLPSRVSRKADSKVSSSVEEEKSAVEQSSDASQPVFEQLDKIRKNKKLFIAIIAFFIFVGLLFTWLCARFSFIFIDDVVRNEYLIRLPFKRFKGQGNSLFGFYLAFGAFSLLIFIGLVLIFILRLKGMGVFSKGVTLQPLAVVLAALPYICAIALILFVLSLVYLVVRDFVQVVMIKDGAGFIFAWKKTLKILGKNTGNFILYILVKIAVGICAWIISSVAYLIISVGLIFQGIPIVLAAIFVYKFLPVNLHFFYIAGSFVLGIPVLAFLVYCLLCVYLPFAVFHRVFSLKFMAHIAPEYNLFNNIRTTEAQK
ncbi:MAG: hypothetical protein WCY12_04765 [Candidatus Omnitrophota bacterium]